MGITRLKLENFKSFKNLDVQLGNFNVIVGANASGKSNFTHVFKFLQDIEKEDNLNNALLINGGLESLRNLNAAAQEGFAVAVESNKHFLWGSEASRLEVRNIRYSFRLRTDKGKGDYDISDDELSATLKYSKKLPEKEYLPDIPQPQPDECDVTTKMAKGVPSVVFEHPDFQARLEEEAIVPPFSYFFNLVEHRVMRKTLLIQTPLPYLVIIPPQSLFEGVGIYDIDPHMAREPVQITGRPELAEDGSNLASVLNRIIENEEKKRKLCNLMVDILPFIEDVTTERFPEKSVLMKLKEKYYSGDFLRAHLLSDGTINVTALIVALFFEEKDTVIIEEPERNIHPHLIARIIQMMKDASERKQIIVTTHSAEIVKHAGLENILLVSRNKEGFSSISRPVEREEVQTFLSHDLGLDEIYTQNLLGA